MCIIHMDFYKETYFTPNSQTKLYVATTKRDIRDKEEPFTRKQDKLKCHFERAERNQSCKSRHKGITFISWGTDYANNISVNMS